MKSIVFGKKKGERSEVYYLLGRYIARIISCYNTVINLSYTMTAGVFIDSISETVSE